MMEEMKVIFKDLPVTLETFACSIFFAASPDPPSSVISAASSGRYSFPAASKMWETGVAGALSGKVANPGEEVQG